MVNMISNQLATLTGSPAPEKPKQPVNVDLPVVTEVRQQAAAENTVNTPAANGSSVAGKGQASGKEAVSSEDLAKVLEEITQHFQNLERDLKFSVDQQSGRQVITVLDSKTKEVIRQIPSEEVQALARMLKGGIGGLIKTEA